MHVLGGQRIDSSHVTVAHSQAYVITDLCWHEQSVRVQRKGAFLSAASSVPQRSSSRIQLNQPHTAQQITYAMLNSQDSIPA